MVPLRTFMSANLGRPREAFLKDVREPHLLLRQRLQVAPGEAARTNDPAPTKRIVLDTSVGGPGNPMLFPVRKSPGANDFANMVTLGRAPGNDIVIPDARVSRLQAFFRSDRGWWAVGDVCSTNGTTVDGKRVTKEQVAMLSSGARIRLADVLDLEFLDPENLFRLVLDESLRTLVNRAQAS